MPNKFGVGDIVCYNKEPVSLAQLVLEKPAGWKAMTKTGELFFLYGVEFQLANHEQIVSWNEQRDALMFQQVASSQVNGMVIRVAGQPVAWFKDHDQALDWASSNYPNNQVTTVMNITDKEIK